MTIPTNLESDIEINFNITYNTIRKNKEEVIEFCSIAKKH